MSSSKHKKNLIPESKASVQNPKVTSSLLDVMKENREFESIVGYNVVDLVIPTEFRKVIDEIESIRKRPLLCYIANVISTQTRIPTSIDFTDDLPFSELVNSVNSQNRSVDILIITNGGSAQQVDKFVKKLRSKFTSVSFILPSVAMSAGTIFIMSGEEIIMSEDSVFGPIDPQIPNKQGFFVPAQTTLTLIEKIQLRGKADLDKGIQPRWTDLEILRNIDHKDIGNAYSASEYSISLVQEFLSKYKFKNWKIHETSKRVVTDMERNNRAREIAEKLCDHSLWKSHATGINRDIASQFLKLKIKHSEEIEGLERAIRRFRALSYWIFERTKIAKIFISKEYCIIRSVPSTD